MARKPWGIPVPEKVEAYYANDMSVALALANIEALENLYLGRAKDGTDGIGLDEYLIELEAQHGQGLLATAIRDQFASIKMALQAIDEPLSEAVINNPTPVDAAYTEIQKMVVLIKTDLPSALGVLITYQDNDGD